MAHSRFLFNFTNSYDSSSPDWPTFLRHHGVKGQVQILNTLESNIEKVKIVLRGIFIFSLSQRLSLNLNFQESLPMLYTTDATPYLSGEASRIDGW